MQSRGLQMPRSCHGVNDMHADDKIDEEIAGLVEELNKWPGIQTLQSCASHVKANSTSTGYVVFTDASGRPLSALRDICELYSVALTLFGTGRMGLYFNDTPPGEPTHRMILVFTKALVLFREWEESISNEAWHYKIGRGKT